MKPAGLLATHKGCRVGRAVEIEGHLRQWAESQCDQAVHNGTIDNLNGVKTTSDGGHQLMVVHSFFWAPTSGGDDCRGDTARVDCQPYPYLPLTRYEPAVDKTT
jgi:hypothetical protein